jgi:hypothetical protein
LEKGIFSGHVLDPWITQMSFFAIERAKVKRIVNKLPKTNVPPIPTQ